MISRSYSVAFEGMKTKLVDVQVSITKGLPSFSIVGLASKAVSESKERIRSSLYSIGLSLPASRITVNLSPADTLKEGSYFDLPITIAVLCAMEILPNEEIINYISMGEIALDAQIKNIPGVLAAAYFAAQQNKGFICPSNQVTEASLIKDSIELLPINNLTEIIAHFKDGNIININTFDLNHKKAEEYSFTSISEIKGHYTAKVALEISAAGGHNLLMIGPPGSGKSMLASSIGGLLPPLTQKEMLDTSLIYSISGLMNNASVITQRPYRTPHHSASMPSLIGGGSRIKPGEITLANNGILFLDELAEFDKNILDALRQPLETKEVHISRVNSHVIFPANFQLIAAMNPCRCGYYGDLSRSCSKAPLCAETYQNKVSGPIIDRMDLIIEVLPVTVEELNMKANSKEDKIIKDRVIKARDIQENRYKKYGIATNAEASTAIIEEESKISKDAKELLQKTTQKYDLSTRAYFRAIKVARTIADLESKPEINKEDIAVALSYRKINYLK